MAEKRKAKKRKEEFNLDGDEKPEKPDPEEYQVAKWMKKNLPTKKTKFLNHNVEYFTGSKAVDGLMESRWAKPEKEGEDPLFLTRMDAVDFLDKMLRHKFFHRAKKVPVSEQELKAKMKKKIKKDEDKGEEKKKKDDDAAESSHAEGKDGAQQEEREKKKKKIRLEMHMDQFFHDGLDAYVWLYDPIPLYYWLFGALVVLGAIAVCMFPLWPPTVRMGVYYLSVAAAGFLMLIIALAILRVIVFCLLWMLTLGRHHLWLFPNLTEDVGFFASFWPLYQYEYKGEKKSSKKKKKEKDSDNEEEDKTEKEEEDDEEDGDGDEGDRSQTDSVLDDEKRSGGERDSETESEGSSQQSQTGKDFEMVDKDEVKDS